MINVTEKDKNILRKLGAEYTAIAALPIQEEKKKLWRAVNDMDGAHVAIWINEIPWHEMNVNDELTVLTKDPFLQQVETKLRREIYQWKHMPADMVLEPYFVCQKVVHNTGIGIEEDYGIRCMYDEGNPVHSHHFEPILKTEDDIYKIKDPVITYDEKATMERYHVLKEIFHGILEVVISGEPGFWYAVWDGLITWFGVQNGFELLMDEPEFVHKCIARMTEAYLSGLDQYENLGLLASNNNNTRIGSGGFGYTSRLPAFTNDSYKTKNIWGSSAAQIFSTVSPGMHDEFALQYEIKWMERFGRNYYGCCEPLHNKLDILRKIPNLHKISFSPWANLDIAVDKAGGDYVMSCKPMPADFARDTWDLGGLQAELNQILEKTKGCSVEILMKDISTVCNDPRRIDEWEKMAMKLVEKYR